MTRFRPFATLRLAVDALIVTAISGVTCPAFAQSARDAGTGAAIKNAAGKNSEMRASAAKSNYWLSRDLTSLHDRLVSIRFR